MRIENFIDAVLTIALIASVIMFFGIMFAAIVGSIDVIPVDAKVLLVIYIYSLASIFGFAHILDSRHGIK